jgi:2-aminoadipate transaminase
MDELEKTLSDMASRKITPKFLYTVPDFQNPAGVTMTVKRRRKLLELARKYKILVIEDTPYRQLRYVGENAPSLYEMDQGEGYVVSLRTFSKILFPGLRLGWITAHESIIEKFVIAKQAMDLCTPTLSQSIAYEYLRQNRLLEHIDETVELYKTKCQVMLKALDLHIPKHPDIHWTRPEGGLFLWMRLPDYINTTEMFKKAIDENVAYVIGSAFYADGGGTNAMRLNFSFPSEYQIFEGVKRLAKVIQGQLKD